MNISLVTAERMSRQIADNAAKSGIWREYSNDRDLVSVERFAQALPGRSILDIGCGHGLYVADFIARGLSYQGIDNAPEVVHVARKEHPEAKFALISLNRLGFPDESFAGIWSCNAITTTPKAYIRNSLERMRRMLLPKGVMMTVVPNYGQSYDGTSELDPVPFWRAAYTPSEFRELFRSTDYQVIDFWEDRERRTMSLLAKK